jgi:PAS domain S-box-containing protein
MMAVETDTHEFHALLADKTSEAAVQLDGQGKALHVNPSFLRMFGYKAKEVLKYDVDRVFAKSSRDRFNKTLAACLENGKKDTLELKALTKKGKELPVRISVVPYRNQKDPGAMVLIRDFSEQLKLSEELEAIRSS